MADLTPTERPAQDVPASSLTGIDQRLESASAALQAHSDRLAPIEGRIPGEGAGGEIPPEVRKLWEDTVRRFTGSIDVRLDILEDELGGLQDELARLREAAREAAEAAQRRLTVRFALGQALLAALMAFMFFVVWPGRDAFVEAVLQFGSDVELSVPPAVPGTDPAAAAMPPEEASMGETGTSDTLVPAGSELPNTKTSSVDTASATPESAAAGGAPAKILGPEGVLAELVETEVDAAASAGAGESGTRDISASKASISGGTAPGGNPVPAVPQAAGQSPAKPEDQGSAEPVTIQRKGALAEQGEGMKPDTSTPAAASSPTPDSGHAAGTVVLGEDRFVIQLVGYRSESSIGPFVEQYGIAADARYLHTRNQDKDWYLVLIGDYATKAEAQSALQELSPKLRELKPWVRPLTAGTELAPVSAAPGIE